MAIDVQSKRIVKTGFAPSMRACTDQVFIQYKYLVYFENNIPPWTVLRRDQKEIKLTSGHEWASLIYDMLNNEEAKWKISVDEVPDDLRTRIGDVESAYLSITVADYFVEDKVNLLKVFLPEQECYNSSDEEDFSDVDDKDAEQACYPIIKVGCWKNTLSKDFLYSGYAIACHYKCQLEHNGEVILDTRAVNHPHIFILDNGDIFPGLEASVRHLRSRAVGRLLIPKEALCEYDEEVLKANAQSLLCGKLHENGVPLGWNLCSPRESAESTAFPKDWSGSTNYTVMDFRKLMKGENTGLIFDSFEIFQTAELLQTQFYTDSEKRVSDAKSLREAGNFFVHRGDFWRAIRKYKQATELLSEQHLPEDRFCGSEYGDSLAQIVLNQSICEYRLSRYEEALANIEAVLIFDKGNCKAHYWAAKCNLALHKFGEALEHVKIGIKLNPNDESLQQFLRENSTVLGKTQARERRQAQRMLSVIGE